MYCGASGRVDWGCADTAHAGVTLTQGGADGADYPCDMKVVCPFTVTQETVARHRRAGRQEKSQQ